MRSVPRGHGADAPSAGQDSAKAAPRRPTWQARGTLRHGQGHEPLRPGPDRTQSGAAARCAFSATNTDSAPITCDRRRRHSRGAQFMTHAADHRLTAKMRWPAPEETVLQAARKPASTSPPSATWRDLTRGACRLCLVEVAGTANCCPPAYPASAKAWRSSPTGAARGTAA